MSTSTIDLGEIEGLGKAIGLLDGSNSFRSDWLTQPGHYLSSVMADDTQRNATIAFVDQILGSGPQETDPDGLVWMPIVSHDHPHVSVYVVVDPTPADYVGIGVGARLTTAPAASKTSVHVPIFRAAKAGKSVPNPILIGQSDAAVIRIETEITLGTAPPLRGLGLSVRIPTTAGPAPSFALTLKGLQLPGSSQSRDLSISAGSASELEKSALQLVLGLARAQADALGAGPLASVIGLLGLGAAGPIPNLPLDQLASQGVAALATWF
jgi:hypothetical protein